MSLVYFSIVLTERERVSCDWVKGTNRRYVQRRMCGAQNTSTRLSIRWTLLERERMTRPLCQEEMPFFYACVIPFSCYGPLGVFCKFNSFFLFIYFLKFNFNFFYLFIRFLHSQFHLFNSRLLFAYQQYRT